MSKLTARAVCELVGHEAIVQEWYRDSQGIGTWSVGITSASGVLVSVYKDKPQPLNKCLNAFLDVLNRKYLPAVLNAFDRELTEEQLAAALSFHYNTGSIRTATWVRLWKAGAVADARESFMSWRNPPEIIGRRTKERDLFFDGKWSGDGTAAVYPVLKPSYRPDLAHGKRVDIRPYLAIP